MCQQWIKENHAGMHNIMQRKGPFVADRRIFYIYIYTYLFVLI